MRLCQLDWLAAESQGIETSVSTVIEAARVSVESRFADPAELSSRIVALLRSDDMMYWAPMRYRRADVSAALQALKDQMREAAV